MDFRRHLTAGRLAELFGRAQVQTDRYLRTMGWRRVAEQEWPILAPQTRRYLQDYATGVNAWLHEHSGPAAGLEFALLGLSNGGYRIAPWDPIDSLAWLKAMAWDLRGNMVDETTRAVLLASGLPRQRIEDLYPQYPYALHPPIVDGGTVHNGVFTAAAVEGGIGEAADLPGIGSNSWVVSGALTATGKPILANDPHLSPSMPGIWYQMGLHCDCGYDVEGFTFSGMPGVVIGHNARIAWGFTNLNPDVTDLYLEKVDGGRYQVDGQWRPLAGTGLGLRVRLEVLCPVRRAAVGVRPAGRLPGHREPGRRRRAEVPVPAHQRLGLRVPQQPHRRPHRHCHEERRKADRRRRAAHAVRQLQRLRRTDRAGPAERAGTGEGRGPVDRLGLPATGRRAGRQPAGAQFGRGGVLQRGVPAPARAHLRRAARRVPAGGRRPLVVRPAAAAEPGELAVVGRPVHAEGGDPRRHRHRGDERRGRRADREAGQGSGYLAVGPAAHADPAQRQLRHVRRGAGGMAVQLRAGRGVRWIVHCGRHRLEPVGRVRRRRGTVDADGRRSVQSGRFALGAADR